MNSRASYNILMKIPYKILLIIFQYKIMLQILDSLAQSGVFGSGMGQKHSARLFSSTMLHASTWRKTPRRNLQFNQYILNHSMNPWKKSMAYAHG